MFPDIIHEQHPVMVLRLVLRQLKPAGFNGSTCGVWFYGKGYRSGKGHEIFQLFFGYCNSGEKKGIL